MSTQYKIAEQGNKSLKVDERSNKLSLLFFRTSNSSPQTLLSDLEPEEVVDIAIQLLQVSLYWHTDNDKAHLEMIDKLKKLCY